MSRQRKSSVLVLLMISLFIFQSMALTAAISWGEEPPITKYTYLLRGTVKRADNYAVISGATVKFYVGSSYRGSTTTNTNGYFSKYITSYTRVTSFTAKVSKSGFYSKSKTASVIGSTCNFGYIYLTPIPPPPDPPAAPVISNVGEVYEGNDVSIEWAVSWGSGATSFSTKFWWSSDSTFTSDELFIEYTSSGTQFIAQDMPFVFNDDEYWYKIEASNGNSGGTTYAAPYGPTILIPMNYPIDDAYTREEYEYSNYGANYDLHVRDYDGYSREGWLRFQIENPEYVDRVTLYAYWYSTYAGHGTIDAYATGVDWTEETLTYYETKMDDQFDYPLFLDTHTSDGNWDSWDVTAAVTSATDCISIQLTCGSGLDEGVKYYTKEFSNRALWPYIDIEYTKFGIPEEKLVNGKPVMPFISDDFEHYEGGASWDVATIGSPNYDLSFSAAYLSERGLLFRYPDELFQSHSPIDIWTGYRLTQTALDIQGPFRFDFMPIIIGDVWGVVDIQVGVKLLDKYGYRIAELYLKEGQDGESIHGLIDTQGGTPLPHPSGGACHLIIQRDGDGFISLTSESNGEIFSKFDPRTIYSLELTLQFKSNCDSSFEEFSAYCFYVRETKVIHLQRPHETLAPFENPLREDNFDIPADQEPAFWKSFDGGTPDGGLYYEDNDGIWRASKADLGETEQPHEWIMCQTLIDSLDFRARSVWNQKVAFSFRARYDASYVRIRSVIQYWETGSTTPVCILGDWYELTDPQDWILVRASSEHKLPSTVDRLRVIMHGQSLSADEFSIYVDDAKLAIVEHDEIPIGTSLPGVVSMGLAISKAIDFNEGYELSLTSGFTIETEEGHWINHVGITVEVSQGAASFNSQGVIEGNSADYPSEVDAAFDSSIMLIGTALKWGTRFFLFASGIGAPASWFLGEFAGLIPSYLINMHRRTMDDPYADPVNGPAYANFAPNDGYNHPRALVCGIDMGWNLGHVVEDPVLKITVIVEWDANGLGDPSAWRTTHSMYVSFDASIGDN